jgi:hypothetical protein
MAQPNTQHQSNLDADTKPLFIALFPWICLSLSGMFVAIFYQGCLGHVSRLLVPGSGKGETSRMRGEYTQLDRDHFDDSERDDEERERER